MQRLSSYLYETDLKSGNYNDQAIEPLFYLYMKSSLIIMQCNEEKRKDKKKRTLPWGGLRASSAWIGMFCLAILLEEEGLVLPNTELGIQVECDQ